MISCTDGEWKPKPEISKIKVQFNIIRVMTCSVGYIRIQTFFIKGDLCRNLVCKFELRIEDSKGTYLKLSCRGSVSAMHCRLDLGKIS